MSKKLAEGLNGLVLDVKTGSGAFLPEPARAIELARTMIGLGEARGCPTVALLTAMDRPLGRACGNALEMEEAIEGLRGEGPDDLMEVTYALGAEMLVLVGAAPDLGGGATQAEKRRSVGAGHRAVRPHGRGPGGQSGGGGRSGLLPQAQAVEVFRAPSTGVIAAVEPRRIGRAITDLGGGRRTVEDTVDPRWGSSSRSSRATGSRRMSRSRRYSRRTRRASPSAEAALRDAIAIGEAGTLTPLIIASYHGPWGRRAGGAGPDAVRQRTRGCAAGGGRGGRDVRRLGAAPTVRYPGPRLHGGMPEVDREELEAAEREVRDLDSQPAAGGRRAGG